MSLLAKAKAEEDAAPRRAPRVEAVEEYIPEIDELDADEDSADEASV
jgi:hypothetical protein